MTKITIGTLLVALSLAAGSASAQTGNKAAAEALFDAGKHLLDAGRFADACPKLAESQRLDPAPGTLLNLADCYEKAGMSASAWATWLEAAAAAKNSGQAKREELARQRAAALKSRLVSITINVPESSRVSGIEISRDGINVGLPMWSTAVPVDPGTHSVVAKAPGRRAWQTTVTVVDGVQPVQVTVPALEKDVAQVAAPPPIAQVTQPPQAVANTAPTPNAPSVAPSVAPGPTQTGPTALTPETRPTPAPGKSTGSSNAQQSNTTQRTLGYVAIGVGVIGVGVGSVFGLQAISKNNSSKTECSTDTLCNPKGLSLRNDAIDAAKYSTIGFGVGAIGLVTGVILWVTAPPTSEHPSAKTHTRTLASLRLSPLEGTFANGISLKGAF